MRKANRLKAVRKLFPIITHPELVPPSSRSLPIRYGDMACRYIRVRADGVWEAHWTLFWTGTDSLLNSGG